MTKFVLDEAIEAARTFFENDSIRRQSVWKKTKEPRYVRVRWFVAAFMRARDPNKFSYPVIANALKHKDHTTALHGVRNAHENWGERLFLRLAAVRPVHASCTDTFEQQVHSVAQEEILAIGEANLARFVSGKGWGQAA